MACQPPFVMEVVMEKQSRYLAAILLRIAILLLILIGVPVVLSS